MYLLKFIAYDGYLEINKLFNSHKEAVIAAFDLEADREKSSYTITKIEVKYEQ
jgi:hypothetical protein